MGLQDFISPDESIKFRSPTAIDYQGDSYDFLITNKRLIWYKRSGLIFKKDNFVCELLENVKSISFKEEGIINKKGIIRIAMGDRNLLFAGNLSAMRAVYNEAQALISTPQKTEKVSKEMIKEPIYIHEKVISEPIIENQQLTYICKVCETTYPNKKAALICEKSHKKSAKKSTKKQKITAKKSSLKKRKSKR
ncbi:MAG: hypothetical protein HYX24_05360 [Candidatus Aenigmarchaeota archaeon]|nr:hypothetical protein [Candidatus Aenigmarchaeota archaeon]